MGLPGFASAPLLGEVEGSAETGTHLSLTGLAVACRPASWACTTPLDSHPPHPKTPAWVAKALGIFYYDNLPVLYSMPGGGGKMNKS